MTTETPSPSSPLLRPLRRGRRAWFAFSLSLFCPGWGHLYSGAIKRGLLFAAVAVFMGIPVIAWMWAACIQGPASMLGVALATAALVLVAPLDSVRAARRLPRPRLSPGRAVALHALFVPLAFALLHAELHWIRSCLVQPFRTPTESMVPTLLPGDYFLVDRRPQARTSLQPGDLVVFERPDAAGVHYAKRVVGLPGDEVEVRDGHLYVDRRRRSEASGDPRGRFGLETLGSSSYSVEVGPPGRIPEAGPLTVPESSVFVLGDARSLSRDSREFGAVALEKVRGRVLHIFWSLDPSLGRIRWERLGTRFSSIFD